ncbi:hypothetical protein [Fibrobacter sp. UWEL]|uniref:hypothetical protein n=1 Tax=Fibrobacter sp. UWEL TaxID=1896209 RepID=UPI00091660C1|nr:hypothetical protein [Fibrobacter sp. UWEL]SHK69299.1 hypothetical protein SAMN05720468_10587 [Fibrobacter sp. UWEL]
MRILLFAFLFVSLVFAQEQNAIWGNSDTAIVYPSIQDTLTDEQLAQLPPMDWSVDSTEIYHQLVLKEESESHYGQNVFGITVGGLLTAAGSFYLGIGIYYANTGSNGMEAVVDGFSSVMCTIISVPLLAVGLPILGYNIYYLNDHRAHARQRDEYLKAENAYNRRRAAGNPNAVNISIVPTIDYAHAGGGMNLMVTF